MASIRKRGSYQWQARVKKKGFEDVTKTLDSYADAETWAAQTEAEMSRGVFHNLKEAEKMTFAEACDKYGEEVTVEKKGLKAELSKLKILKNSFLGRMSLVQIQSADIAEYRKLRLITEGEVGAQPKNKRAMKRVSAGTVIKEMNLISGIYATAASEWRMRGLYNPVSGVKRPRQPKGRERRLTSVQQGEVMISELDCVIDACESHEVKMVIRLAVETAMRRSEMVNATWRDVDLNKRILRLDDTKNGESRTVPLSTVAVELLRSMPRRIDGKVFSMRPNSATQAFGRAVKRARHIYEEDCAKNGKAPNPDFLINLRLHDMRHEATSRLFERGDFGNVEVASITGHKDLRSLMRYTHLQAEELAKKLG
jgi:integrase